MSMEVAECEVVERRTAVRGNKPRPVSLRSSSTTSSAKEMDVYVEGVDIHGRRVLVKDNYR